MQNIKMFFGCSVTTILFDLDLPSLIHLCIIMVIHSVRSEWLVWMLLLYTYKKHWCM